MDNSYKDELPILLSGARSQLPDESIEVELIKRLDARCTTRSSSMSLPYYSSEASYESQSRPVYHTGPLLGRGTPQIPKKNAENPFLPSLQNMGGNPARIAANEFSLVHVSADQGWEGENYTAKNEHLLRSGPLGKCNDPYCTTCPTYYAQPSPRKKTNTESSFETTFQNTIYGGAAKGWIRMPFSFLGSCVPGIMNPHAKAVQRWNKFFVISCLVAIFIDPLVFFLLSLQKVEKCIVLNWSLATTIAVVRSVTDFIYFLHILLQFRLAYVAPESRVVGAGDLVDLPKRIAFHYLRGYFFLDLFVVLPLPQIMILFVLPKYVGSSAANYAKNLLRATVLLQYIPRIVRFVPLVIGQSASGFIFESAWANFVINLLIFILAGHVVGSCWYLFGLQRVNQCLRNACSDSTINKCKEFVDCGRGNYVDSFRKRPEWESWRTNANATKCLDPDNKFYGIYNQVVVVSTKHSIVTRYVYSLFWGFQQISTLAGNQTPSAFVWEVLFTMGIIGLGLLLFALLIGNMQNFLLSLGRRRLEMQLRRRDVEQWMSHRRLPEELRRLVRQSERFNWAATQGVNEDKLLDKLPEDLQRKIRRHLFKFVKKVRIFTLLDEPIIDAICEKLRQKLYIKGSKILYRDGPIDTMVFIVRGNMESVGGDGNISPLKEGDVCGEELLTWCLEHSSGNKERRKVKISGHRLLSNRTVRCLTNVDAFALRVADLEEVTAFFARYLRNPRVQGVIRYASPYWRTMAATRIQVAWRYRKKRRLNRSTDQPDHQQSTQWSRVPISRTNEVMGR